MTDVNLQTLKYIQKHGGPIWQGLVDGRDAGVNEAVANGYLKRGGDGFVLTEKALKAIEASVCPCCGQAVKASI